MAEHLNFKRLGYNKKAYQATMSSKGVRIPSRYPIVDRKRAIAIPMTPPFHLEDLKNPAFFDQPARLRHDIEKRIALSEGEKPVVARLRTMASRRGKSNREMAKRAAADYEVIGH